jgi:uncharacterized protein
MSLKDRIGEDIKTAMKSKDKVRLETVRSIKKVILEKESSIRGEGRESLTEAEEMDVLLQQAKQRRDSIDQYVKAGREDLADKERQELVIIEEYLPKQLTEEEVSAIVDEVVAETGAASPKDLGKVIGATMQRLKGQTDGKLVQQIVKAKLGA